MNQIASPFQEWVEANSKRIFSLAYRMTGQVQDAEEIVQETFLKAYLHKDRFRSEASPNTWLYRIATNCALDLLRKHKRNKEIAIGMDEIGPSFIAVEANASQSVENRRFREQLGEALKQLTPMERAAFTLRHYEALTCQEVGEALGCNSNRAKQAIFRAVRKLRKALKSLVTP